MSKPLLLAFVLAIASASANCADEPAKPAVPASQADAPSNRLITKIVRGVDGRRNWEGSYAAASATRRINMFCLKSDTGRCGFRVVDAHKNGAGVVELQVEWIGLVTGGMAERTLKGESYAVCVQPDVGHDDACEPATTLTTF